MKEMLKLIGWVYELVNLFPPRRVLIVENDEHDSELLRIHVESLGWEAVECRSPRAALRVLEAGQRFRVALVDIAFPSANGIEFAEELRAHPQWRKIAVTYVTGSGTTLSTVSARKHWSFILKDAEGNASLEAVRSVLQNGSMANWEAFITGWVIAMACTFFGYRLENISTWLGQLIKP